MIVQSAVDLVFDDVFFEFPKRDGEVSPRRILKLEGYNPSGSVKFKAALNMIEEAEREGRCTPGQTEFIESSSGNMGLALSLVCRVKGYRFLCVADANCLPANRRLIELFGGRVCMVDGPNATSGLLGARLDLVERLLAEDPRRIWLNQYANPANRDGHRQTTGAAIFRNLERVDALVVGAGTTGTLMGCAQAIQDCSPATRLIAVDTVGSVIFGGEAAPRHLPGIGSTLRSTLLQLDLIDGVEMVTESEGARACHKVLAEHALCLGASSGAVLVGMDRVARSLPPDAVVVGISPDFGERYRDSLYDPDWLARHGINPEEPTDE